MKIVTVDRSHFEQVLPLIAAYQIFYRSPVDEEKNRRHFSQFLDQNDRGILFLATGENGAALGFATIYYPFSSVRAEACCLMNDLFTVPEARGQGIGRALIAHCREHAKQTGFGELFWFTEQSNHPAQKLYHATGASSSAWLEYILRVDSARP